MKANEDWFEVYTSDEENGTETIENFETEIEAINYIMDSDRVDLNYDTWTYNTKTNENEKF